MFLPFFLNRNLQYSIDRDTLPKEFMLRCKITLFCRYRKIIQTKSRKG